MGGGEQMSEKTFPRSFRLNGTANARLEAFCELTGMRCSEVVKAAIAQFVAPTLGNTVMPVRAQKEQASPTEFHPSRQDAIMRNDEIQSWFKSFWRICDNRVFAERVIKTIKDKWEKIYDKCPEECGEKYNSYCNSEAMKGREYKHPNSWINDGGYDNEMDKTNTDGGLAYDVE